MLGCLQPRRFKMTSAQKYILYLTALHLILGWAAYELLAERRTLFLAVELALLCSAYVAFRIYRSIIAPVGLLSQGAAALEDQDFSVKLMPTGSREMDGVVGVYNQMIEQLRSERVTSRQREEFLDRLLDAAELGVVVLNFDGEVLSMNPWMRQKCQDEAFRLAVLDPLLHLRPRPKNEVLTGPDNRRYLTERASFIDRGFERGFLIVQDVTTDLLSAEKEAYGKVIRMMAHEVNNSNAAIVSVLKTLEGAAEDGAEDLAELNQEYLPVVIGRAQRMTEFMRNFARVVRLPQPERKVLDMNALLRRTGEVMRPKLREAAIELHYDFAANTVSTEADAGQLEQVVINALTNSLQSIGGEGNIWIRTTETPCGFSILDDGAGLTEEAQRKVFTPFFSSKPTGQGVGLTLARDILEAHGARYHLRTNAEGLTEFSVVFA